MRLAKELWLQNQASVGRPMIRVLLFVFKVGTIVGLVGKRVALRKKRYIATPTATHPHENQLIRMVQATRFMPLERYKTLLREKTIPILAPVSQRSTGRRGIRTP